MNKDEKRYLPLAPLVTLSMVRLDALLQTGLVESGSNRD